MCRIDGAERMTLLQEATRTARKAHFCGECCRVIAAGERYNYQFGAYEGESEAHKTCPHCMVARDWLLVNCGGWIYEQVGEEIIEHAEEYPKLALPLLRLAVGMRRMWKGFHGGLMPLPKQAPAITV